MSPRSPNALAPLHSRSSEVMSRSIRSLVEEVAAIRRHAIAISIGGGGTSTRTQCGFEKEKKRIKKKSGPLSAPTHGQYRIYES